MGLFGNAMGIMGDVARGTASTSMWTGNMIYTALQNARTKKEIRALYKRASDAECANSFRFALAGADIKRTILGRRNAVLLLLV